MGTSYNFLQTFFEYLVILLDFLIKIDYYMNKLLALNNGGAIYEF